MPRFYKHSFFLENFKVEASISETGKCNVTHAGHAQQNRRCLSNGTNTIMTLSSCPSPSRREAGHEVW